MAKIFEAAYVKSTKQRQVRYIENQLLKKHYNETSKMTNAILPQLNLHCKMTSIKA